ALPFGEVDIHDDQRWPQAAGHRLGLQRNRRGEDVETLALQDAPELIDHRRVILDQQDLALDMHWVTHVERIDWRAAHDRGRFSNDFGVGVAVRATVAVPITEFGQLVGVLLALRLRDRLRRYEDAEGRADIDLRRHFHAPALHLDQ